MAEITLSSSNPILVFNWKGQALKYVLYCNSSQIQTAWTKELT